MDVYVQFFPQGKVALKQDPKYRYCSFCVAKNCSPRGSCIKWTEDSSTTTSFVRHLREFHSADPGVSEVLGNTNLMNSIVKSEVNVDDGQMKIYSFLQSKPKSISSNVCQNIAMMIVMSNLSFNFVEEEYLHKLIKSLCPPATSLIPGRTKIRDVIVSEAARIKLKIKQILKTPKTKISLTIDGWTSRTQLGFLAIVASFVYYDKQAKKSHKCHVLLDIRPCTRHTAPEMSTVIQSVLQDFDIKLSQICSIVCDNASSNEAMIRLLNLDLMHAHLNHRIIPNFCFQHSTNRAIQAMLKVIHPKLSHVRSNINAIRRSAILSKKLRELVNKQRSRELPHQPGLPCSTLILDCPTRWNSTYEMCERLIHLKTEVEILITENNAKKKAWGVLKVIKPEDWDLLGMQYFINLNHV